MLQSLLLMLALGSGPVKVGTKICMGLVSSLDSDSFDDSFSMWKILLIASISFFAHSAMRRTDTPNLGVFRRVSAVAAEIENRQYRPTQVIHPTERWRARSPPPPPAAAAGPCSATGRYPAAVGLVSTIPPRKLSPQSEEWYLPTSPIRHGMCPPSARTTRNPKHGSTGPIRWREEEEASPSRCMRDCPIFSSPTRRRCR